ncbi:MAG TPA: hypothetical protein VJB87_02585, partial [Candidatus Nanoarchaeia archaeon]|nr:hypothetical protein [Candidatus Nanoarchaeia archaeon]
LGIFALLSKRLTFLTNFASFSMENTPIVFPRESNDSRASIYRFSTTPHMTTTAYTLKYLK